MKRVLFILLFSFPSVFCFAGHIAGGEIFYRYLGITPGTPNSSRYEITVRLFRECVPPPNPDPTVQTSTMPTSVIITLYNNNTPSTKYGSEIQINQTSFQVLPLTTPNPCIIQPPAICYQVGTYRLVQDLPNTSTGYIVAFQTCCRTYNVANVESFDLGLPNGSRGEGATYSCEIPGSNLNATRNSSAVFSLKDTTLVCNFAPFTLDFSATDPDAGDSLSYGFCSAFDRGNTTSAAFPAEGYSLPPFNTVTYSSGFSGSTPLGPDVTINPVTGIISGKAPAKGRYVVSVCITEWKNKIAIRQHRKDFTLIVEDCSVIGAQLKPMYLTCDGFTMNFENESTSANVNAYLWDFGEKNIANPTSTQPTPSHTYSNAGTYSLKLKVTNTGGCQDSASAIVSVFPGFTADFNVQGNCFQNAYKFLDASTTNYGLIDSWKWNFGDSTTLADTARSKDSAWKYTSPRAVQASLIVTNTKGCIDTITKPLTVLDKPSLNLPFRDTLICSNDTLMLKANISSGSVLWTPANGPNKTRISNANTTTPLVYPKDTTRYYVAINDNGCANSDSVTVNVLQFITVDAGLDTGICRTDTFRLRPTSEALSYLWTASTGERVDAEKYPVVRPLVTTQYNVIANLGKCQARDSVLTKVAPYPTATAGSDMTICFGTRVQLQGAVVGSVFSWSPTNSLINENTLTPTAGPSRTTVYVLSATDTVGCPKPKTDTIIVTVIPPLHAFAGNDTTVYPQQPVQLQASGGTSYTWTPPTGLSNPLIANPIATLNSNIDSVVYTVRVSEGICFADDQVIIHVYKPGADIIVPSAFTPNGDGLNDVARPITVGITKLNYFSIYNRWGQLVFSTTEIGKGWDGNFSGVAQASGTYVYQALGTDTIGNAVFRKGTIVLIR